MKNFKSNELRIRMTDNEKSMIDELAKELRMNMSECARMCIRDKYNSLKLTKELQKKLSGDELVKVMEIMANLSKDNTAS